MRLLWPARAIVGESRHDAARRGERLACSSGELEDGRLAVDRRAAPRRAGPSSIVKLGRDAAPPTAVGSHRRRAAQSWSSPCVEPLRRSPSVKSDELVAVVPDEEDARDELLAVHAHVQAVAVPRDGEQRRARARAPRRAAGGARAGARARRRRRARRCSGRGGRPRGRRRSAARRRRRTRRAQRAGRRGRGRRRARSGSASRTGRRRRRRPCSSAAAATAASEPSPPAMPRISAPAARASSPGSSPWLEEVRLDAALAGGLARARRRSASRRPERGLIEQEGVGPHGPQVEPNGPWRRPGSLPIMPA